MRLCEEDRFALGIVKVRQEEGLGGRNTTGRNMPESRGNRLYWFSATTLACDMRITNLGKGHFCQIKIATLLAVFVYFFMRKKRAEAKKEIRKI